MSRRACGSAALRLGGFAARRLCGLRVPWRFCGFAACAFHGSFAALRLARSMAALRLCGLRVPWQLCGFAVLRLARSMAALRLERSMAALRL